MDMHAHVIEYSMGNRVFMNNDLTVESSMSFMFGTYQMEFVDVCELYLKQTRVHLMYFVTEVLCGRYCELVVRLLLL